ncbi:MAG: hypothetical protein AAF889_00035 [Cyanobacteria bacterium P01_D01_bin.73]
MPKQSPDPTPSKPESERLLVTLPGFTAGRFKLLSEKMGGEALASLVRRAAEEWVVSDNYDRLLKAAIEQEQSQPGDTGQLVKE